MIISTTKPEVKEPEWKYPCLGVASDGEIILFFEIGRGTFLNNVTGRLGVSEISLAMDLFEPYTGEVTLKNG